MIAKSIKQYTLTVSEELAAHIKANADIIGITETEYIRECITLCLETDDNSSLTKADFENINHLLGVINAD